MARIDALDGLRGVAVLAVLASHVFAFAHGGFLGVDVFFVLSGFLITTLLLAEHDRSGRIDFRAFYLRRAARLVPAYLLMLAIAVPIMLGPLSGRGEWPVGLAVAASAVYVANWVSAMNVDALGPIVHTWSLSIEEQFYVLWPAAFALLVRTRRSFVRWLSAGVVAVVTLRIVAWVISEDLWPYFATVTHADGLLVGCLLAVVFARRRYGARTWRTSAWVAGAGIAALAGFAATLSVESGATYVFGLSVAAIATSGVVWHLMVDPAGRLARGLAWRPLAGVGRISYGLYLFHMPIFQLVQKYQLGLMPTLALEVGATLLLAVLSWYGLERPVQRWARLRGNLGGRQASRVTLEATAR